ncbi:unnamed protein product, partial [Closterium sp. Naga37s-1]
IFLELLEPYILTDHLSTLPPEVMQALVEHYSERGWLSRVQQCVLHMDIASLDINQVVRLLRQHPSLPCTHPSMPFFPFLSAFPPRCYRLLLFLKLTFSSLNFPPGSGAISPSLLPSAQAELLNFLLKPHRPPHHRSASLSPSSHALLCSPLARLLSFDPRATLSVLRVILRSVSILDQPQTSTEQPITSEDSTLVNEGGADGGAGDGSARLLWCGFQRSPAPGAASRLPPGELTEGLLYDGQKDSSRREERMEGLVMALPDSCGVDFNALLPLALQAGFHQVSWLLGCTVMGMGIG